MATKRICGSRKRRSRSAGFTIFEVLIALLIITTIIGVATRVVRSTFEAQGRRLMGRLQGTIKYMYHQSIITGRVHRLSFQLTPNETGVQTVTGEAAEGEFVLGRASEDEQDEAAKTADAPEAAPEDAGADGEAATDAGASAPALIAPTTTSFAPMEGPRGITRPYELSKAVRLIEVRVAGREAAITEGEIALHFFPMGQTEKMTIIVSNEAKDQFFVLTTNPLTGSCRMSRAYPEEGQ